MLKPEQIKWNWSRSGPDEWTAKVTILDEDGNIVDTKFPDGIVKEVTPEGTTYTGTLEYEGDTYTDGVLILSSDIERPVEEEVEESVPAGESQPEEIDDAAEVPQAEEEKETEEPEKEEETYDKWEGLTEKDLKNALRNITEKVKMVKQIWDRDMVEYQVKESHIRQLYGFNEQHRDLMPNDLTDEERQKWNHFNGLKKLTEEDVEKIFGKDHPIIGVAHSQTMDRIETVVGDFFSWTYFLHEYSNIFSLYQEYQEEKNEHDIQLLKEEIEKTGDPKKKEEFQTIVDQYYYKKNLDFLREPLDEATKKRISTAIHDAAKLDYWLTRSSEKLNRMGFSSKIIGEIHNFETRFMEPRYHRLDDMLVTYFLNLATYCKPGDENDEKVTMVGCMTFALDSFVRKNLRPDIMERVLKNVEAFEDQMLEYIPDKRDMSELHPSEKPDGLAGDFSNANPVNFGELKSETE